MLLVCEYLSSNIQRAENCEEGSLEDINIVTILAPVNAKL
jgi:hypothetical protein